MSNVLDIREKTLGAIADGLIERYVGVVNAAGLLMIRAADARACLVLARQTPDSVVARQLAAALDEFDKTVAACAGACETALKEQNRIKAAALVVVPS